MKRIVFLLGALMMCAASQTVHACGIYTLTGLEKTNSPKPNVVNFDPGEITQQTSPSATVSPSTELGPKITVFDGYDIIEYGMTDSASFYLFTQKNTGEYIHTMGYTSLANQPWQIIYDEAVKYDPKAPQLKCVPDGRSFVTTKGTYFFASQEFNFRNVPSTINGSPIYKRFDTKQFQP